jgi:hypothetical protein
MTVGSNMPNLLDDLSRNDADLLPLVKKTDGTEELITALRRKYPPPQAEGGGSFEAWDLSGKILSSMGRVHEALAVYWAHYQHLLECQRGRSRIHKGTPLVRISDCFQLLGFPVHTQRYLMLTLCEDAIQGNGKILPQKAGVYFRLVLGGLPATEPLCRVTQITSSRENSCEDFTLSAWIAEQLGLHRVLPPLTVIIFGHSVTI